MFIYYLLLAFLISIDSFGIGITYGLKNTKFSLIPNMIVFIVTFAIPYFCILLGSTFLNLLPDSFANILSSLILIFVGIWIVFHPTNSSDFDGSNSIDRKEAFFLGLALSMDSLGTSLGISNIDYPRFVFPLLTAFTNSFLLGIR